MMENGRCLGLKSHPKYLLLEELREQLEDAFESSGRKTTKEVLAISEKMDQIMAEMLVIKQGSSI